VVTYLKLCKVQIKLLTQIGVISTGGREGIALSPKLVEKKHENVVRKMKADH